MAQQMERCDVCGKSYKGLGGLAMHRARIHEGKKWNNTNGKASAAKAVAPTPAVKKAPSSRSRDFVLQEVWSDHNGRILLTDQNGDWWVAKKLDV